MKEYSFENLSYLQLFRRQKDSELSTRAYAVYSYLVGQSIHGCGATYQQISDRTGLDYSGVNNVLDELRHAGSLVYTGDDSNKQLVNQPSPEQWNNLFHRNSCEGAEWQKRFVFTKTYIRKIGAGLSFNQSIVFSQIAAFLKYHSAFDMHMAVTNTAGLCVLTGLCNKTVTKIIDDLEAMGLIGVRSTGRQKTIGIFDLDSETDRLFLHSGETNNGNNDAEELAKFMKAGKGGTSVDVPAKPVNCSPDALADAIEHDGESYDEFVKRTGGY